MNVFSSSPDRPVTDPADRKRTEDHVLAEPLSIPEDADCPLNLNTLWAQMLVESEVCCDPLVMALLATGIKNHDSFADALAALIGRKLGDRAVSSEDITALVKQCYAATPDALCAGAADIRAIRERDPACPDYVTPFLFFKGYHAVQCYRVANWLWHEGRRHLAQHMQSRASELFGVDIHPAARLGRRILLDHGTGIVIGETSVVEDDVSLLQGVTLGGTGKHAGDRHPKICRGVLIGAGAKVLGNITVGEGAKIGAGSIVLEGVPPYTTVVGNPARKVGTRHSGLPSLTMDQTLPPIDYII